jgi:hypothetical protein
MEKKKAKFKEKVTERGIIKSQPRLSIVFSKCHQWRQLMPMPTVLPPPKK